MSYSSSKYVQSINAWALFLAVCAYAKAHAPHQSPELLFALFAQKMRWHKEFNAYLNTLSFSMKRDQRKIHKRKLFIRWFYHRYSGRKRKLTTVSEVADLVFASERTVEKDLMSPFDLSEQEEKKAQNDP